MNYLQAFFVLLAITALSGCTTTGRSTEPNASVEHSGMSKAVETSTAVERKSSDEPLKVAFVYVGPVGNAGWSFAHDQGRRAVEARFGSRVQTTFIENVPEFDEKGDAFRELARQGNRMIFGTTFGYMEPIQSASAAFPDVKFENAEGFKTASNVRTYAARTYESAYLAGILAGHMTRTNRIGFVGSIPMPEIISVINAYTLGARSVNAKIRTNVVWVNSWFNPPAEDQAARELMRAGADILFQSTDSGTVIQAAQSMGRRAIGWDSNMKQFGPRAHLASAVLNWAPYYTKTIQDALDGTWRTDSVWWGLKEHTVDLVDLADDVPLLARTQLMEAKLRFVKDSFFIWRGPLADNRGEPVLKQDEIASRELVQGMNFYVYGVDSKFPR